MYQNDGYGYQREPMAESQARASRGSENLHPQRQDRPSVDLSSVAGSVRRRYDGSAYDGYDY